MKKYIYYTHTHTQSRFLLFAIVMSYKVALDELANTEPLLLRKLELVSSKPLVMYFHQMINTLKK